MPLVKRYSLLLIAALILTTACSNETPDEVRMLTTTCSPNAPSPSFENFFLGQQMPTGLFDGKSKTLRYTCQSIPEKPAVYYYSTLFDENTGIAVLSAYIVNPTQAKGIGLIKGRAHSWRVNKDIFRQGTDALYYKSGLDKGHLNPVKINSFDTEYVKSTFSYTNAVPQYPGYNRGEWKKYESKIADYVQIVCAGKYGGTMYLLTGTSHFHLVVGAVSPTQDATGSIDYFPNALDPNRIVRPNSMWTAGCCVWKEKGNFKTQSIAVMGNNDSDKGKLGTTSMTLAQLEDILVNRAKQPPADLFPSFKECRQNSYLLQ